jgi:N,N'-diacetylchitobiose transport system substrate-binding protein
MKTRIIAVVALAAALAIPASTASGGTKHASANKIVVWLMNDAQTGWPQLVGYATSQFKAKHPDVDVDVQYQTWGNHLTKFDASLAANGVGGPDVIELGNTETAKYVAAKAFVSLKASTFANSKTWLTGLSAPCTSGGKTYCIPYYAGARAVIYRKDLYRKAGIRSTPSSLDQFIADGKKLMKKNRGTRNFSAVYFPGKYWYAAMAFVYDYGGQIAVKHGGKWKGTLESPKARKALAKVKLIQQTLSSANKRGDEGNPQQALVFAKGHVASFIGNGWEWPYALDKKVGNPSLADTMGAYPMPSHVRGKYMPTFLGGSDLGVPVTSKNKSLAADWIRIFTSTKVEQNLAKKGKVIANSTAMAAINRNNPKLAPFAQAAKASWFVPLTPNWVNVENANVLQNMLAAIATNRKSVAKATHDADNAITKILNAKS